MTTIDDTTFAGCDGITALTIPVTYLTGYFSDSRSVIQSVTILSGTDVIAAYAFENYVALTTISIPDSVTMIENNAFDGCAMLTGVTIPVHVTAVGDSAFNGCESLTSIEIPNSVISIGDYAFNNCATLARIVIPNSVTSISDSAFNGCASLPGITIPVCNSYAHQWAKLRSIETFVVTHQQPVTDPAVAPTCLETGLTEGQHCAVCEEILIPQEIVAALGHDWADPEYTWAENHLAVSAQRICKHNNAHVEQETVAATSAIALEPTCLTMGKTTYTSGEFGNKAFTIQSVTLTDIDALGHRWGDPAYTWNENHSAVTATRICGRDEHHQETETVPANSGVAQAATCLTMGKTTYTSEAFENPVFLAQTVTLTDIPALGHDWAAATYTWNEDNTAVTATRICKRDGNHKETETAGVTTAITLQPTCLTMGKTTYTSATYANTAFAVQTKVLTDVPALGHSWGAPTYVWNDDHSTVTATRVCSRDAGHKETESVPATGEITKSPTDTTAGQRTYRSTSFTNAAFDIQQITVNDLPALRTLNVLRLPAATLHIEDEAFEGCAFQGVIIPDGCTSIGSKAFADCENLQYVCIPASVTTIAGDAFTNSELAVIDRK